MYSFALDLRLALRRLRNSPGFTLVAVLTLALGIGANAVVFSAINSLLLHRLPIREPNQILFLERPNHGDESSYPDYRDLRDRNTAFSSLFAYCVHSSDLQINADAGTQAEQIYLFEATANYFQALDTRPFMGRFFTGNEDAVPDANPVAVLSYASWNTRFDADPNIVGKTIALNKHPFTVIGVAGPGFQGTEIFLSPEMWVPISMVKEIEGWSYLETRGDTELWLEGRLKPGLTPQQAEGDINVVARHLAREFPRTDGNLSYALAPPGFLGSLLGKPLREFFLGLSLLSGLVLLAASTNLGSLLAARVADRQRELGVSIAMGARRSRILQQLMIEGLALALAGGAVGVGIDLLLVQLLNRVRLPMGNPIQVVVSTDKWVIFFAALVSLASVFIFSLVPARQIWKTDPNASLRNADSFHLAGKRLALRDLLLAVQVAVCCVLVTACFTSLRGLTRALQMPLGFDPRNVVMASYDPRFAGYKEAESAALQKQIAEEVSHLPGVTVASYASSVPLSLDSSSTEVFSEKVSNQDLANGNSALYRSIAPGYLKAAGTRLILGRDFRWEDDAHSPQVAIVNMTFAKEVIGGVDGAVGKHFRQGVDSQQLIEVVGVVEDGKYDYLTENPRAAVFFPGTQRFSDRTTLLVRSVAPDPNLAGEIRNVIRQVDPAMPVYSMGSWEELLGYALFPARAATVALTAFGILGLLLAITGIYGLAAYTVARRMRELGIRIALGAQQRQVLQAALGRTFVLLASGSVVGLLLGIAAGRVLANVVYQASANDPVVLISVAVTMMLVGLVATAIPARRAVTLDAVRLLRQE